MKIALALLLSFFALTTYGVDEPLPGDTMLNKLPENTKVVVKRSLDIRWIPNPRQTYYVQRLWPIVRVSATTYKDGTGSGFGIPVVIEPTIHKLANAYYKDQSRGFYLSTVAPSFGSSIHIDIPPPFPETVDDFRRLLGDDFDLVFEDPDAAWRNLPPEVVMDLRMTRILNAIQAEKHDIALPEFEKIERMKVPLPESFYYYWTLCLSKSDQKGEARLKGTDYLKRFGKDGKYYTQVLEIVSRQ